MRKCIHPRYEIVKRMELIKKIIITLESVPGLSYTALLGGPSPALPITRIKYTNIFKSNVKLDFSFFCKQTANERQNALSWMKNSYKSFLHQRKPLNFSFLTSLFENCHQKPAKFKYITVLVWCKKHARNRWWFALLQRSRETLKIVRSPPPPFLQL